MIIPIRAHSDYDLLFTELADLGYEIDFVRTTVDKALNHNQDWQALIRFEDASHRVHCEYGYGPSPYYALLAAKLSIKAWEAKPEADKTYIGFSGKPKLTGAQLLKEIGL